MATATREVNCVNCSESYEVEVNYTVEDQTNPIDPFQRKEMFVVVWEVIPTTCPHCHNEVDYNGEAFEKQLEEEIKEDIIKDAQN
jgi:hypothetical protein